MKRLTLKLLILTLLLSSVTSFPTINFAENNNNSSLKDGEYNVKFELLTEDDESSEQKLNEENIAILIVKDNENKVHISLTNEQVLDIEIQEDQQGVFEDDDFEFIEIEEEKNDNDSEKNRTIKFIVKNLTETINTKIHVKDKDNESQTYHMKISFKKPELIEDDEDDNSEDNSEEDSKDDNKDKGENSDEDEIDDSKVDESETTKDDESNQDTNDKQQSSKKEKGKYKDGTYPLPFEVWKDDEDEVSTTEQYIKNPAKLIVKDEVYKVRMTLTDASWWQYLKVESNKPKKYKNVRLIKEDKKKNTKLVEFTVKDLDKTLNAKVHLLVKEINYNHKYKIRFNFDTSKLPLNPDYKIKESKDSKEKKKAKKSKSTKTLSTIGSTNSFQSNVGNQTPNEFRHMSSTANQLSMNLKQSSSRSEAKSNVQAEIPSSNKEETGDHSLAFDRDADEAMPEQETVEKKDKTQEVPQQQLASLDMLKVSLFSILLLLSIGLLIFQIRNKAKNKE